MQSSPNEGQSWQAAVLEAKRLRGLRDLTQDRTFRHCKAPLAGSIVSGRQSLCSSSLLAVRWVLSDLSLHHFRWSSPSASCKAGTTLTSTGYRTLLAMEHIPGRRCGVVFGRAVDTASSKRSGKVCATEICARRSSLRPDLHSTFADRYTSSTGARGEQLSAVYYGPCSRVAVRLASCVRTNCTPWCRWRAQTLDSGQSDKSEPIATSGTLWQAFKVAEQMRLCSQTEGCKSPRKSPTESREPRLSQISAAMQHVGKRFFHRDVNSHNILVQAPENARHPEVS